MVNNKIKVGMVGISFGMEFIPIYMKHPDVYEIAIADTNLELIKQPRKNLESAVRIAMIIMMTC